MGCLAAPGNAALCTRRRPPLAPLLCSLKIHELLFEVGFDVLDRRTGELANFVENVTAGTLTLVGDTALTTSANTIVATDIVSGTKLWESPALGYSMQHVQVSGGRLYYREQGDGTTGRLLAFGPP